MEEDIRMLQKKYDQLSVPVFEEVTNPLKLDLKISFRSKSSYRRGIS